MHNSQWVLATGTYIFIALMVIALHEAAHLVAAHTLGIKVRRIGLSWRGAYIVREPGPAMANLLTTLAGPILNLLLVAAWPLSHEFALLNLVFALGNLLPVAGSDGSRAWSLLAGRWSPVGVESYNSLNEDPRGVRVRHRADCARNVVPSARCG